MSERPVNPKPESLDDIIGRRAVVLADQIQKAAAWAKSEMDLQIEVAGALKEFAREAKIKLDAHHNITVATGRPDSVYSNVIVEYKDPGTLSGNRDAANNKKVIEQIRQRFYDMRREENRPMNSMFGVGTDGKYFVFVRFRHEKWTDEEPLEVNRHSTERFLWALYNLGQKGKPYQPEYLQGDFGSESLTAQEGVRTLYDEILKTENPKAQVFFDQWKILFGEVCGYDVENLSDKLKKLAEFYGVKGKPHPGPLLFALHTYYALLIKLLAAEIVSFFNPWMTRQVEKLQNATTSAKLQRELEQLERGGIFHEIGITNFLEGDLFSWYLPVWSEAIEKVARQMIQKLDDYNPGTFSEDPAQSRDLLKKLYQQLFPKSVRHDLGEYYTPDWLADHVLNELGYEGDPDKRLLDPACGSGTFLVMAINRIRRWYDANREKCSYDEGELLKRILANVVGFDLNPLAVMAARTNYLVAIKDLIRHVDHIEMPVYLCDSIMTPAEYGDLFAGASLGQVAKVPCSAMKPPHLLVPKEIAQTPKDVAKYAEVLERCVQNGYAPEEFLTRCRDEGLNITATQAHSELYKELVKLDKANKNGIWARIIKNNFAPLFVGRVDYVVGNPPWVNWDNLPEDYRHDTKSLWISFGLFTLSGTEGKLGGGKKDISMLFVYQGIKTYLKRAGRLGFLINQSVFKTEGAADGFRRFSFPVENGKKTSFRVFRTHDMSAIQPFEGATNRTSVICCEPGQPTSYPVKYPIWLPTGKTRIDQDLDLIEIRRSTRVVDCVAVPVIQGKITSPWLTTSARALPGLKKALGMSDYSAHAGATSCGADGIFLVRPVSKRNDKVLVANYHDAGKKEIESVEMEVDGKFLYRVCRGKDLAKWSARTEVFVLVVQDPVKRVGMDEALLKTKYAETYEYLNRFQNVLKARKSKILPKVPFYSIYGVDESTFAPVKVAWGRVANTVAASVLLMEDNPWGPNRAPIPYEAMMVACSSQEEAFYLCACLNSCIADAIVRGSIVLHPDTHVLRRVAIPKFDPKVREHSRLSKLGQDCQSAVRKNDLTSIKLYERDVDKSAAIVWGITDDELKAIQEALVETVRSKQAESESDEED